MQITIFKDFKSIFFPHAGLQNPILTLLLVGFLSTPIYCQDNVFSGRFITDINFSQIQGDLLAGFHRIGYGAGIGVSYRLAPQWSAQVELMYRNIGSRTSFYAPVKRSIDVHMAQIPVYASYNTWWDNGLSRIHFDGGLIFGRILETRISIPQFQKDLPYIRKFDYSLMGGFGIWFNQHHGLNGRYVRALSSLLKNPQTNLEWKIYYISLEYNYRF